MREFGSEFNYYPNTLTLPQMWQAKSHAAFFRCGRDAIFAAAEYWKKQSDVSVIYVPALACESMYSAFVNLGYSIRFYRIDEAWNPVFPKQIRKNEAIMFMLYYGMTNCSRIQQWILEHECNPSILDVTHSIWDAKTYKMSADFLVGSIRKSVGIVNGGILLTDRHAVRGQCAENLFTEYRRQAFVWKERYAATRDPQCKDRYRQLLAQAEQDIHANNIAIGGDGDSEAFLHHIPTQEIRQKRIGNYIALYDRITALKLTARELNGSTPFSLPIWVKDQQATQSAFAQKGLYAPVLWPIAEQAREVCAFAKDVADHMLSLPIDQRYDYDDMLQIAAIVQEVLQ